MNKYKIKFLSLFLTFVALISLVGCATQGTVKNVIGIEFVEGSLPSEAYPEEFDVKNGKLLLEYDDGTTKEVPVLMSMVDTNLINQMKEPGTYDLVISYKGFNVVHKITIKEHEPLPEDVIKEVLYNINAPTEATDDFTLPTESNNVTLSWKSQNEDVILIDEKGYALVVRPSATASDIEVTIVVTATFKGVSKVREYQVKVLKEEAQLPTPKEIIDNAKKLVVVPEEVKDTFTLPVLLEGVAIKWSSSNTSYITISGSKATVKRPTDSDVTVTLTATFTYSSVVDTEKYQVKVIKNSVKPSLYDGPYYNTINLDSVKAVLKADLRKLITDTHKKRVAYKSLNTYLTQTDVSLTNSNKMVLFYSGIEVDRKWDGTKTWNKEHCWPQSLGWFGTEVGAGSDAHHIRPTDSTINSKRSSHKYGEVPDGSFVVSGKATGYVTTKSRYKNGIFEPRDEVKGDVARILFYLMIRYNEADSYKLTTVATSVEMLLRWNEADPVDSWEMNRNNVIEGIQGNRNPFIDHPELASVLFK